MEGGLIWGHTLVYTNQSFKGFLLALGSKFSPKAWWLAFVIPCLPRRKSSLKTFTMQKIVFKKL